MKTTMNISVNPQLKQDFIEFAKSIKTTPTDLITMLMKDVMVTRSIKVSAPKNTCEFEAFSQEEIQNFWEDFIKRTNELNQQADEIFSKLEKEWKL